MFEFYPRHLPMLLPLCDQFAACLPGGLAQRRNREYERIQFLVVPQLGEVKTDRGHLAMAAIFDGAHEPADSLIDRILQRIINSKSTVVETREQPFHRPGGLFHTGTAVRWLI